jgi:hypothetical protein
MCGRIVRYIPRLAPVIKYVLPDILFLLVALLPAQSRVSTFSGSHTYRPANQIYTSRDIGVYPLFTKELPFKWDVRQDYRAFTHVFNIYKQVGVLWSQWCHSYFNAPVGIAGGIKLSKPCFQHHSSIEDWTHNFYPTCLFCFYISLRPGDDPASHLFMID